MESVLQINNGQIAVLGGLMQDTVEQVSNSIPLLSDIPLLGDSLFRSRSNDYERVRTRPAGSGRSGGVYPDRRER